MIVIKSKKTGKILYKLEYINKNGSNGGHRDAVLYYSNNKTKKFEDLGTQKTLDELLEFTKEITKNQELLVAWEYSDCEWKNIEK